MLQGKINSCNETVSVLMYFIAGLSMFVTAQMIIMDSLGPFYIQILFIMIFAAVIVIRHFINGNFLIYMIAHFTLFLTLFTIPLKSVMFIVFAVYLIIMTVWSVMFWKNNGESANGSLPWISFVLLCAAYIYAYVSKHDILKGFLLVSGCMYFLLYPVRLYLKGLYDISKNRLYHRQLPMLKIIRTNSFMIGIVIAFTALALIVAGLIDLDGMIYVLGDGALAILKVLIRSFIIIFKWFSNLFKDSDYMGLDKLLKELGDAIGKESLLSKLLNIIFTLLKLIISAAFLMWVFKGMDKKMRQYLKDNIIPTDRVERLKTKDTGIMGLVDELKKTKTQDIKNPIRRRYKKAVMRHKNKIVLTPFMTTGQIEAQLSSEDAEGMKSIKEAYERERYRDER